MILPDPHNSYLEIPPNGVHAYFRAYAIETFPAGNPLFPIFFPSVLRFLTAPPPAQAPMIIEPRPPLGDMPTQKRITPEEIDQDSETSSTVTEQDAARRIPPSSIRREMARSIRERITKILETDRTFLQETLRRIADLNAQIDAEFNRRPSKRKAIEAKTVAVREEVPTTLTVNPNPEQRSAPRTSPSTFPNEVFIVEIGPKGEIQRRPVDLTLLPSGKSHPQRPRWR